MNEILPPFLGWLLTLKKACAIFHSDKIPLNVLLCPGDTYMWCGTFSYHTLFSWLAPGYCFVEEWTDISIGPLGLHGVYAVIVIIKFYIEGPLEKIAKWSICVCVFCACISEKEKIWKQVLHMSGVTEVKKWENTIKPQWHYNNVFQSILYTMHTVGQVRFALNH